MADQNEKSFIFLMKSEDSADKRDNPVILESNPNQMLYAVCFIANDYIEIVIIMIFICYIFIIIYI